jgi:hypothetical protein
MSANRDQFNSWLQTLLRDRNWQFARSGMKLAKLNDKQQINTSTGYWDDPTFNASKPPRWIINFETAVSPVKAMVPGGHRSERIG